MIHFFLNYLWIVLDTEFQPQFASSPRGKEKKLIFTKKLHAYILNQNLTSKWYL